MAKIFLHGILNSGLRIFVTKLLYTGDGTREELLTIEYFKLLNEKNGLIKKQMELNYM